MKLYSHVALELCLAALAFVVTSFAGGSRAWATCGDYLLHESADIGNSSSVGFPANDESHRGLTDLHFPWQQETPCNAPGCQQSRSQSPVDLAGPSSVPRATLLNHALVSGEWLRSVPRSSRATLRNQIINHLITMSGLFRPPQNV